MRHRQNDVAQTFCFLGGLRLLRVIRKPKAADRQKRGLRYKRGHVNVYQLMGYLMSNICLQASFRKFSNNFFPWLVRIDSG
jgi:hypothetical protein